MWQVTSQKYRNSYKFPIVALFIDGYDGEFCDEYFHPGAENTIVSQGSVKFYRRIESPEKI